VARAAGSSAWPWGASGSILRDACIGPAWRGDPPAGTAAYDEKEDVLPNFASTIRDEVRRLARKESRAAVTPLRKQIHWLRRSLAQQRRALAQMERAARAAARRPAASPSPGENSEGAQVRFSPAWMKKHRARLKMSREKYAKLLGASAQSVLGWESGRTRPRRKTVEAWARLRRMGVREIRNALDALRGGKKTRRRLGRRPRRRPARAVARRKVRSRRRATRRR